MNMPDQGMLNSESTGIVIAVRGSVVDMHFDAHFPPIYTMLHAMQLA
jgi:hypothetical protein